jgi:GNAT superfamily N-acetyltransferase
MRTHRYPYAAAIASRPDLLEVLRVRHLQGRDLRQVEELTATCRDFAPPLSRPELEKWRETPGTLGLVAECDNIVLGAILAQDEGSAITQLMGLYVGPLFRRLGIGTILLRHVLAHARDPEHVVYGMVPERADACLLFLRAMGWKARALLGDRCHMEYTARIPLLPLS